VAKPNTDGIQGTLDMLIFKTCKGRSLHRRRPRGDGAHPPPY